MCACSATNEQRIHSVSLDSPIGSLPEGQTLSLPFHSTAGRQQDEVFSVSFSARLLDDLARPSLLISRAGSNFQIYLDDEWIFGRSFEERPMAHTWNTPYLIPLSAAGIRRATNIRIRLFAFAGDHTLLEPIQFGEHDALSNVYKRYRFMQADLTAAITVATGFLAILSFIFWISSGRSKTYLLPIGASIALILANLNYFVVEHYLPHGWWQAITHASLDWFGVFVVLWVLEIKGIEFRHNYALWIWGGFCTVVNALLPANWMVPYVEWLHFVSIGIVLAALITPPNQAVANKAEVIVGVGTAMAGSALCLFDLLLQFQLISGAGLPRFVPILFFAMFLSNNIILLARFSSTFKAAKRSNEELADMVSEREAEIDRQYSRLRQLELSQARMEERSDIMREIHDSMGGHLMSAINAAAGNGAQSQQANEEITSALQSALLEMRLLINNSPHELADAGDVLGSLRGKIEPLLSRAGIQLHWEIDPFGELPQLSAKNRLHLIRILQECITNVLKHANADTVTIRSKPLSSGYEISVHDNGTGATDLVAGNGTANMKFRTDQLGGTFSLQRVGSETVASLLLPNAETP